MIVHYLKVAFRSLMKYKMQTAVSIVGLAVGFVCFAFSMIWIRYELTYDSFHPGAERMYVINEKKRVEHDLSSTMYGLSAELSRKFPELERAITFESYTDAFNWEGETDYLNILVADSSFVNMFGVKLLAGNWDFLYTDKDQIAITRDKAIELFGTDNVLGRKLEYVTRSFEITAVVEGFGKHTNIPYEVMLRLIPAPIEFEMRYITCVRLREGTDREDFERKLNHSNLDNADAYLEVEPLTDWHFRKTGENAQSMLNLRFFVLISILVILAALFNYFSIMVSRILIRARELTLRVVCGSSRRGLFVLFGTEMFLILAVSGMLSMVLIELATPKFHELSGVEGSVMLVSAGYFLIVFLLSMLFAYGLIKYYSRRSLMSVLHSGIPVSGRRVNFHQVSTLIQFVVSALVLFVVSVIQMQMYHLQHTDLGFERSGRAVVWSETLNGHQDDLIRDLRQLPYVKEVCKDVFLLFPRKVVISESLKEWEGKSPDKHSLTVETLPCDETFFRYYGIRLLEGRMQCETSQEILLNEAAVKALGWNDALGKKVDGYTVVGVVKDMYTDTPLSPVSPIVFKMPEMYILKGIGNVLVRFDEEYTDELKHFFLEWAEKYQLENPEPAQFLTDVYDGYLTAERSMSRLLGIITVVCVIVTLFGVYSHVTLSCERRRKEIAIRKVNGATSADIIRSFLRQYFYLLLFSCVIALPLGTFVMLHWLEQYVERTPLYWWIYAGIVAVMYVFVVLCIGRSVWRAANENPAEVIKSE